MLFFITGITGRVGGRAARALMSEGHRVRALVRDPAKAAALGAEVVPGSLTDADAIAKAMEGVDGAFLLMPPQHRPDAEWSEAKAICAAYRSALTKYAPPRAVVLSSIGSEQTSKLGLITATSLLERALADVPFPLAIIRAGSFLENYAYTLEVARATGFFDTFLTPTSKPVPMIASEDIGHEVARRLAGPAWTGRKVIELGTPCSPDQVARTLGDILDKEVKARAIPREHWSTALQKMGFPEGGTTAFEEMEDGFNAGWIAFGRPDTEAVGWTIDEELFLAGLNNAKSAKR